MRPFSERYGYDRGVPIDRTYIDAFFARHAHLITGAVLEVRDAAFTERFGRDVSCIDLVDINPRNAAATIIADLSDPGSLPAESFDCVIVPQTLQYVADASAAIANLWQAVRSGGALLVTVPAVARIDPQLGDLDRWRFNEAGLRTLLEDGCLDGVVDVEARGNLVTTIASLLGLATKEIRRKELDHLDGQHALVVCGVARRLSGPSA
jgi:SAM-dependent methyltransferase